MSDDEQHTSTVIVALPAATDQVHGIGEEQKHATLVFLGDLADDSAVTVDDIIDAVTRWQADPAAGGELSSFTAAVTSVESLGEDGARVWMLDGASGLQGLHDALLTIADVKAAYDAADQYPTYTPHVTIGYPQTDEDAELSDAAADVTSDLGPLDEATETAAAAVESITFDRLAIWAGPDQREYQLSPATEGAAAMPETKSKQRKPRARRELERQREYRLFRPQGTRAAGGPLEARASGVMAGDDETVELVRITGTVIVYGVPYEVWDPWGSFTETIHFGACTALLANTQALDCRFLTQHEAATVIARTTSGTTKLELIDTPEGLTIDALVDPRITDAADLVLRLEHQLITQMSVGMVVDPKGDVWSGEDDWGLPNVRDIYSLCEVPDVSAVTYPASPTTSVQLAERAWSGVPTASRARTRKLWEIAREGRAGKLTQHDSDVLMHVIERLHAADEGVSARSQFERREDVGQDAVVTSALQQAHAAITTAVEAQAADPDNATDLADKAVWNHLTDALTCLNQALAAQEQDTDDDDAEADADQADQAEENTAASGDEDNRSADPQNSVELLHRQIDVDRDRLRLARTQSR